MADLTRLGLSPGEVGLLSPQKLTGPAATKLGMSPLDVAGLGSVGANPPMLRLLDSSNLERSSEGMTRALVRIGVPSADAAAYIDCVRRGGTLEAIALNDDKEAQALEIMRRRAGIGLQGAAGSEADIVIPIIEEELSVGKREFDAGGVRVSTHVSARPVAKTVSVIEERIKIERRVVDRPIDALDEAFRERALELKASAEEPLITKRAHVVEEIRIHKDRTERIETVKDALRHTEVDLAELPSERPATHEPLGR